MPRAFVIMPFDAALQSVYLGLVKEVLEAAGYEVRRADDLLGQRNILQDIIESIEAADLVVADLTDNNPNVFYELGIAHTRLRPTILLTQSVEDVPFDLRSYRLIPYSTHFADIGTARNTLREYAEAAITGKLQFSNPVGDYLRTAKDVLIHAADPVDTAVRSEDESLGFLDHSEALETGMRRLTEIIVEVGGLTTQIGNQTQEAAIDIERSRQGHSGGIPYGHLRRISTGLATALETFTTELATRNEEYRHIAEGTEGSLEFMVRYSSTAEEHQTARDNWLDTLQATKATATQSLEAYESLANTMDAMPAFEKSLLRATKEASRQVRQMGNNIRLTIASIDRALSAAERE